MKKQKRIDIIPAWIGYTDGRPYIFINDHGQKEWCVFTNRAHARQAFQDVRRCKIVVQATSKPEGNSK